MIIPNIGENKIHVPNHQPDNNIPDNHRDCMGFPLHPRDIGGQWDEDVNMFPSTAEILWIIGDRQPSNGDTDWHCVKHQAVVDSLMIWSSRPGKLNIAPLNITLLGSQHPQIRQEEQGFRFRLGDLGVAVYSWNSKPIHPRCIPTSAFSLIHLPKGQVRSWFLSRDPPACKIHRLQDGSRHSSHKTNADDMSEITGGVPKLIEIPGKLLQNQLKFNLSGQITMLILNFFMLYLDHFPLKNWLVVGPPLWKIWKSIGMIIATQYWWENAKLMATIHHQPDSQFKKLTELWHMLENSIKYHPQWIH